MSHSVHSAVEEALNASSEDPEQVVHEALMAVIAYAKDKPQFRSPRMEANLADAVSHGEASFKIQELRKAVEDSALGVLTDALHLAWKEQK